MKRPSLPYGSRGKLRGVVRPVRDVAPTFGKEKLLTHSVKAGGQGVVEADAERLVAQLFMIAPEVIAYKAQPFVVDLIDKRIYRSKMEVAEARARHESRQGPKFYFPDFEVSLTRAARAVVEVKLEGYEGTEVYTERLSRARGILEAHGSEFMKLVVPRSARHPLRTNAALLANAQRRRDLWPEPERAAVIANACGVGGATVADVCDALGESADLVPIWLVSGHQRLSPALPRARRA
jgi:hypothetical protein